MTSVVHPSGSDRGARGLSSSEVPTEGRSFRTGSPFRRRESGPLHGFVLALTVLLPVVPLACGGAGGGASGGPQPYERVSPLDDADRLYRDDAAVLPDTIRWVVKDQDSLREIWTQATQEMDDPPDLPDIDFDRHMVVVVGAGRCHPGDQIQVESWGRERVYDPDDLTRMIERTFVVVRTTVEPDPFPGESYPIEIVRIPRTDLAFRFKEVGEMCKGS